MRAGLVKVLDAAFYFALWTCFELSNTNKKKNSNPNTSTLKPLDVFSNLTHIYRQA